ncbi:hypothetical protein ACF09H_29640 [Streptomyces sp. NPDC014983]|uniref:hypothetical protein n=1 Tax=Streptomyces sp. NPDC014983 TaxID=3364933 RepID=UPI0036F6D0F9
MSRYGNRPDPHHEAPSTLWAWAAELDRLGNNAERRSGRHRFNPNRYFAIAQQFRNSALTGALKLDGVPAMWEGFVLAPHILHLSEHESALRLSASDELEGTRIPMGRSLEETMSVLYPALARTVADCTLGTARSSGPALRTGEPCAQCRIWADTYLPSPAATSRPDA